MNAHETLPSELRMAAPPSMPQARSYMFKQKTEYTEYQMAKGNKIRINIPRLQRTYLSKDSYLRFRLNVDASYTGITDTASASNYFKPGGVYLDRCGAYSLFERIEVYDYLGGTLIESVANVPQLMTILQDVNCSLDNFNGKNTVVTGQENTFIGVSEAYLTDEVTALEPRTCNSGKELLEPNWTADDPITAALQTKKTFVTYEFSIPIPSFLGLLSDKFVPLHNGFSIDFFLNSTENAFISYGCNQVDYRNQPAMTDAKEYLSKTNLDFVYLNNVEFCAQVMELGNDAEALVLSSNGSGPLVVPSTFYRYFTDMIKGKGEPDQSSTAWMDLNLNVVSLRNIRFGFRPKVYVNNAQAPTYGHRIRNFLSRFTFQYGSSYLPEIAGVQCRTTTLPQSKKAYPLHTTSLSDGDGYKKCGATQAFAELLKTGRKGHWPDMTQSTAIQDVEYFTDIAYAASQYLDDVTSMDVSKLMPPLYKFPNLFCGKFLAGLDLRLSSKEIVSGIDTNGLLVRLNAHFDDSKLDKMHNAIWDVFCEHDAFVQIIPGVATTVTF
jgi:hypothetical protein